MYSLVRMMPKKQLLLQQIPALGMSLVTAELFYKFHSFTLECIAFLATWFAIDAVACLVTAGMSQTRVAGLEDKLVE